MPLSIVQILEFELGTECNLGHAHVKCPNRHPQRYGDLDTSRPLTDEKIVECATIAYRELGFTGLVGWIYYNEPLLQQERLFRLIHCIRSEVPESRFMLWTNGVLIPTDCERYGVFEQLIISGYNAQSKRGRDRLVAHHIPVAWAEHPRLDERLNPPMPEHLAKHCLRPFVECIIDNYGNTHLCCYDWQGRGTFGSVWDHDLVTLAGRWRERVALIAQPEMSEHAPAVCLACRCRWSRIQEHDSWIVGRALRHVHELAEHAVATCR